jgi:hypothetical protein
MVATSVHRRTPGVAGCEADVPGNAELNAPRGGVRSAVPLCPRAGGEVDERLRIVVRADRHGPVLIRQVDRHVGP